MMRMAMIPNRLGRKMSNSLTFYSRRRWLIWVVVLLTFTLFITNRFSTYLLTRSQIMLYQYHLLKIPVPIAKNYSRSTKDIKTILYWDNGHKDVGLHIGEEIFKNCPVSKCRATNNKAEMPVEQFDAIIFHGARYSPVIDSIPKTRSLHQKYIFLSLEAPYNTFFDHTTRHNFYNWTMTYRRDSDIHFPYGIVQEIASNYSMPSYETITRKKKTAAWFVSNCATPGSKRRLKYARELQKYIDIDIFGKCGNFSCPVGERKTCYEMLEREYYFYLSFENSLCADYVTEKLFNILKYDVVPVVYGSSDYSVIAPPRSVINVYDFDDPAALGYFLQQLSSNYEDYIQYFEWKKQFGVFGGTDYTMCQLCELLHSPPQYSSYEDIKDWFYGFKCVF